MTDSCASWLAGDGLLEDVSWPATRSRPSGCLPVLLAGSLAVVGLLRALGRYRP